MKSYRRSSRGGHKRVATIMEATIMGATIMGATIMGATVMGATIMGKPKRDTDTQILSAPCPRDSLLLQLVWVVYRHAPVQGPAREAKLPP